MKTNIMKKLNKESYKNLLSELTCDHCHEDYCFLKKFMESLHPEPRVLIQLKCIEKLKWERSKLEDRDIGWNEAGLLWALEGWAKQFEKVFDETLSIAMIYKKTKEYIDK